MKKCSSHWNVYDNDVNKEMTKNINVKKKKKKPVRQKPDYAFGKQTALFFPNSLDLNLAYLICHHSEKSLRTTA